MKYVGNNISIAGSRHIKKDIVCQDSSGYHLDDNYSIAIVCDGHGGYKHFRSNKGSLFAVEVGINAIKNFLGYENSFSSDKKKLLIQLEKNIILNWNKAVNAHYAKSPFTENELNALNEQERKRILSNIETAYGTTLIAILITERFSFCIQIGDGDCVILKENGDIELPMPGDDRLLFDVTTSLCDREAIMNFRHVWLEDPPVAALISTDGIRNSFTSKEYFIKFCRNIFESYNDTEVEQANSDLAEFLPELSERGSGDDVSISIIFDRERLQNTITKLNSSAPENETLKCNTKEHINGHDHMEITENEKGKTPLTLEGENEQNNKNNT